MIKLLKKEFLLAMHPTVPIMLLLSVMVLIPNYPYTVIFFYSTLATFFTCVTGRENNDITYTFLLPVAKADIVKARMGFTVLQQITQLIFTIPFLAISAGINPSGNLAGMDANIALLGEGFLIYGCFNYVFFTNYYKNTEKVGKPFALSSIAVFFLVAADSVCSNAILAVADYADSPGLNHLFDQFIFLAAGVICYIVLTALALKKSVKCFVARDL